MAYSEVCQMMINTLIVGETQNAIILQHQITRLNNARTRKDTIRFLVLSRVLGGRNASSGPKQRSGQMVLSVAVA